MLNRRVVFGVAAPLTVVLAIALASLWATRAGAAVGDRLTNQEFWKLATDFSEPDGTFHSENLVSNEFRFQAVMPRLVQTAPVAKPGHAYVGVGPEQNFTYIVALKPDIAFIVDIRRGNLDLHLIYKALFELSADRADFVSRLFSRKRPAGLTATSTVEQIFAAYEQVPGSPMLYEQNLKAIEDHLMKTHGFALTPNDLKGIAFVYESWFTDGPDIHYQLTGGFGRGGGFPTYADLMEAKDASGHQWGYLATEASFKYLKDLESRNLVVPVVGNFGGPKALRAVATFLKQKQEVVGAFYTSNVEQYLRQDGIWHNFCASAATLPLDSSSTLIRSTRGGFSGVPFRGPGFDSDLMPIAGEVKNCNVPY
jgi:hypothetical protein